MIRIGFYENWSEEQIKSDIIGQYCTDPESVNKFDILLARCDGDSYDESSYFLLREKKTGKLFENHASHCSCSGFEGQFDPKETTVAYLTSDHFYAYGIEKETVCQIIKSLGL